MGSIAIGDDETWDVEAVVIYQYLVEDMLCDRHVGSFKLNDTKRLERAGEDDGVAAFMHRSDRDRVLYGNQVMRVSIVLHQEMKEGLTHLFFGR